ncbi:MAG: cysteine synthase A [Oligoflexia bacterium]|nr:cysteine synthase A [Oligoflexia bacterium]MBF0366755.1 cysteine synthase A [Oligoflexia bacterium]
MKYKTILEMIGNTPHLEVTALYPEAVKRKIEVWAKVEKSNPGGSIKDRIALAMVEEAEKQGVLRPGMTIVEPTSGNTGIGLAMVAAIKNYPILLVMPESMSIERRKILKIYGAELELTPKEKGMSGAVAKACEILGSEPSKYWMPSQFENSANVKIHQRTTAQEIIDDFGSSLNYLITGVGTGGHITGVGSKLRETNPSLKIFAVEPKDSSVLSGSAPGPHPIQGIGAGFVPAILRRELLDEIIPVTNDKAFEYTRLSAKKLGLFIGISSGASLAAVAEKMTSFKDGSIVLTFTYDTGERYLSMEQVW